jgi:hypothetical protein
MKVHIIIFYQAGGIEYIPDKIPVYTDENEVKKRVNLLNKKKDSKYIGTYGYITKELI